MNLKDKIKKLLLSDDTDEQSAILADIRLSNTTSSTIELIKAPIKSVKKVRKADNEYVYDIGMKNESKPWYFGNNILIHNSVYFSAYPTLKNDIDNGNIEWNKDIAVELYDNICDIVNESFPGFMVQAFNCPTNRGNVIQCGREIVAISGLFITKKRYAVLYYDKEGKRKDTNGKEGEIKAMGLDLKRADTPEYMQDFLSEILSDVLHGLDEQIVLDKIKVFRTDFKNKPGWDKGTPKRVNNIGKFLALLEDGVKTIEDKKGKKKKVKVTVPGHVTASINWNRLLKLNGDRYSMNITDGFKVIVCKLNPNVWGFNSVAYPIDEPRLPQWFKDLPFNHKMMEESIIDKKLGNLLSVLDYDIKSTEQTNQFVNIFEEENIIDEKITKVLSNNKSTEQSTTFTSLFDFD